MTMTPKHKWIFNFLKIVCRKCGRCERIFERLHEEIGNDDFDVDKDTKAHKIITEES